MLDEVEAELRWPERRRTIVDRLACPKAPDTLAIGDEVLK
jgi:hypothetical protein